MEGIGKQKRNVKLLNGETGKKQKNTVAVGFQACARSAHLAVTVTGEPRASVRNCGRFGAARQESSDDL